MRKLPRITKTCASPNCGLLFTVSIHDPQRYCTKQCWDDDTAAHRQAHGNKGKYLVCPSCNNKFWATDSEIGRKYCSRPCYDIGQRMDWRVYRGYVYKRITRHPLANKGGYVFQHRLVYWEAHGSTPELLAILKQGGTIHHINCDKEDNQPKNLELRMRSNHPHGVGEHDMVKVLTLLGYTVKEKMDESICSRTI